MSNRNRRKSKNSIEEAEKHTKKCCETCEFNAGIVCMGYGKRKDNKQNTYGMPIEEAKKMFPDGCSDWGISFNSYVDYCENE